MDVGPPSFWLYFKSILDEIEREGWYPYPYNPNPSPRSPNENLVEYPCEGYCCGCRAAEGRQCLDEKRM